jgi:uncharacterized protein (DUF433 family)
MAPAEDTKTISASLEDITRRMGRLEEHLVAHAGTSETSDQASRWMYLIARPHRWRRQLSVKGRNMTVGQLVSTIHANRMTPEQASERLDLPVAAIYEALMYFAENRALIDLEASEERRRLAERGLPLEPQNLPR